MPGHNTENLTKGPPVACLRIKLQETQVCEKAKTTEQLWSFTYENSFRVNVDQLTDANVTSLSANRVEVATARQLGECYHQATQL